MSRTNESPMDFQWQQGYGPAGADSPFLKSPKKNPESNLGFSTPNLPFGSFDPSKKPSAFASSSSSSITPLPFSAKLRNPSFTTPQQKPLDVDFSSGAENQSSPANGDTEDTPEPPSRKPPQQKDNNNGAMVHFRAEKKDNNGPPPPPSAALASRHGISGRGEIQRRPAAQDLIARRVHKRKRRDGGDHRDIKIVKRRPYEDSDSEEAAGVAGGGREGREESRSSSNHPKVREIPGLIPSFFSYLETHPNLPHILSYYAQFLLNFFLVSVIIYMIYAFWSAIRADVDEKSKEAASEILVEMALCAREFRDNKCDGSQGGRVPAMESLFP
ncbi:MAG: hypothetical protein Q9190_000253 [Brigantiaea leucoxantha]